MIKHAYLILAHNEFALLQILVSCLDDERNDIFIHIDKKVSVLPEIVVSKSNLFFVESRIDVRWGSVSVLEAEYSLMQEALSKNNHYLYFHLISGVDLPLLNQDKIHDFFYSLRGKEFIGFSNYADLDKELRRKINFIHIFHKDFKGSGAVYLIKKIIRAIFIRLQLLFGYKKFGNRVFKKGTQWVSITESLVRHLIDNKERILKTYKYSFCPDEIFIQTEVWSEPKFRNRLYDYWDESNGSMRYVGWKGSKLPNFEMDDIDYIFNSGRIFARKFSADNMDVVNAVINRLKIL